MNNPGPTLYKRGLRYTAMAAVSVLVVIAAFFAGFASSWFRQTDVLYPIGDAPARLQEPFRVYWEAWNLIEQNFYSEVPLDETKMLGGAIEGTVASLGDSHSMWVNAETATVFAEDLSGTFQGIGATVNLIDGRLTIIEPMPSSPAQEAGLLPGDVITAADGQDIAGMSLLDAVALIRGPEGTSVTLLIERTSDAQTDKLVVVVARRKFDLPTVTFKMLPGNVGYIQLSEFNAMATQQVRNALQALLPQNPTGIILDLRNDPGGYLNEAIGVASEFIAEGNLLTERQSSGEETVYQAQRGGLAPTIPLAVLVNGFSASASEIVAGAIQDYGRGVIVGSQTYGKGSMQIPYSLSDGSSLVLTVAHWYTPNDRLIEGDGLTPDIVVEPTEQDLLDGLDVQLDAAVSYLIGES